MNLAKDAWIPVLNAGGDFMLISLTAALCRAGEFRDLAVLPHERVALMRLLLCIVHAALRGPAGADWKNVPELLPGAAEKYLDEWKDNLELFHPTRPFLQIAGLRARSGNPRKAATGEAGVFPEDEGSLVKVSKLDFALATGNNSTLFAHQSLSPVRALPPERLALLLLAYQNFSPGGLIGKVVWQGQMTPPSSNDGPCAVKSMLHSFWRGNSLLETLHRNLCHRGEIDSRYDKMLGETWGRPVWEMMPQGPDDASAIRNATSTYLGRLVPLARLILLQKDHATMLLGAGPVYPNYNSTGHPFVPEPTATTVPPGDKDKKPILLGINPDKALWRELHALVVQRRAEEGPGGFWAAPIALNFPGNAHELVVAGMSRDQAEIVDSLESVYHIPAAMCGDAGRMVYEEGVRSAESMAGRLGRAVRRYRQTVDCCWENRLQKTRNKNELLAGLSQKAFTFYWTKAEQHLPLLFACVRSLGTDDYPEALRQWNKALYAAARQAFSISFAPQTPRQFRAFARGTMVLAFPQTIIGRDDADKESGS